MNVSLFSQEYGEGHPLLILHGLLGASGNWHTLSRTVFASQYRVYAVDLRNHGRSPHADRFDYDSMVEDVVQFMQDRELDAAHIMGHSMGGKVAMKLALKHSTVVSKLVVADIAPRAYPPHHMHILNALKNLDLSAYASRKEIDNALSVSIGEFGVRQFLLKNLASNGAGQYSWKMNLPVIYNGYSNINEAVTSSEPFDRPALFIKGGRSNYIAEKDQEQIQSLFSSAQIREIPGVGHWVHAEASQIFGEMVMGFLGEGSKERS